MKCGFHANTPFLILCRPYRLSFLYESGPGAHFNADVARLCSGAVLRIDDSKLRHARRERSFLPLDCEDSSRLAHQTFLLRTIASRASLSAVFRRSVSRLSQVCLPLAKAISTFTLPLRKYSFVGIRVSPFCWVLPISLCNSFLCTSNFRVRKGSWLKMFPCS